METHLRQRSRDSYLTVDTTSVSTSLRAEVVGRAMSFCWRDQSWRLTCTTCYAVFGSIPSHASVQLHCCPKICCALFNDVYGLDIVLEKICGTTSQNKNLFINGYKKRMLGVYELVGNCRIQTRDLCTLVAWQ